MIIFKNIYYSPLNVLKKEKSNLRINVLCLLLMVQAFFMAGSSVRAQDKVNPLAETAEFIIFTKADATLLSNESEGPAAIGGNLNIGDPENNKSAGYAVYSGSYKVPGSQNIPLALLVNGGVNYFKGRIAVIGNQKGYVKIGQLYAGAGADESRVHETDRNGASSPMRITKATDSYDQYDAAIELSGNRFDFDVANNPVGFLPNSIIHFDQVFEDLKKVSGDLKNLQGTVYSDGNNQGNLRLIDNISDVWGDPYIWNTDASFLSNLGELKISFTPTAERPLIINVSTGADFNFKVFNMNGFNADILPYVLWHFPSVVNLNISEGNTVEGSIFAPYANLRKTGANNIQGQVVVNSFYQSTGELHNFPFRGLISFPEDDEDPMPVTLFDFSASKENNRVLLSWQTTDETNSSYFEIERSRDGKQWNRVGKVSAQGASVKPVFYSFSDDLLSPAGPLLYYRLKMVDMDGSYEYSRMVSVETGSDTSVHTMLYPNPAAEKLFIEGADFARVKSVEILNQSGLQIMQAVTDNNTIDVSRLKMGLYIVRVKFENGNVGSGRVFIKN